MAKTNNKIILYSGLALLFLAIYLRSVSVTSSVWLPLFCVAILLKTCFLVRVFRSKSFKPRLWFLLILCGVVLILLSMLFKYVFVIPWLRTTLFYGALFLKSSGLLLMVIGRVRVSVKNSATSLSK